MSDLKNRNPAERGTSKLRIIKVVCTSKYTKKFVEDGEERSIASYCTHEEKTNFEGFPENGCYGNQPQPLEVLFDSTDCNNPCSFTKQG